MVPFSWLVVAALAGFLAGYVVGNIRGYNSAARFIGDRVGRPPGDPEGIEYGRQRQAEYDSRTRNP
jgi:hypothetical protein